MNVPTCDFCSSAVAPGNLLCTCGRLAYGKRIAAIARDAETHEERGATAEAIRAWESTLAWLPPDSGQAQRIRERLDELRGEAAPRPLETVARPRAPEASDAPRAKGLAGIFAFLGIILFKFKSFILAILGKLGWIMGGALKVAGFVAKGSKFLGSAISMVVAIWAYAQYRPLPFAVGFVAMIWVHEMGHVIAAKFYGHPVSAPIFIPFVGAFIRSKRAFANAAEDAWVGLGGPLLGSAAGFIVLALAPATGQYESLAYMVGSTALWLNLFNLLPIYPLDGGRAASVLTFPLWLGGSVLVTAVAFAVGEPLVAVFTLFPLPRIWAASRMPTAYSHISTARRLFPAGVYVVLAAVLMYAHHETQPRIDTILSQSGKSRDISTIANDTGDGIDESSWSELIDELGLEGRVTTANVASLPAPKRSRLAAILHAHVTPDAIAVDWEPHHLWRTFIPNRGDRIVALEVAPGFARVHVFTIREGAPERTVTFPIGKAPLKGVALDQRVHGFLALELTGEGRQGYAITDKEVFLVHLEDASGSSVRNVYSPSQERLGPKPPLRTLDEWDDALTCKRPEENLRTLVWLAGKRAPVEGEAPSDARNVQELLATPRIREAIAAHAKSSDPWIESAAKLAASVAAEVPGEPK